MSPACHLPATCLPPACHLPAISRASGAGRRVSFAFKQGGQLRRFKNKIPYPIKG